MAKLKLLLTADYEVFGNGSGCVEDCVVKPSNELMEVCESVNSRVTFFFEVCAYWAFKEIEEKGLFKNNYKPASLIKQQLQAASKKGHDIQLHLHPQWLDYEFLDNCHWNLEYKYWRLPFVPNGYGDINDPENVSAILSKGIQTLQEILAPTNPEYKCTTFRAGAWSIQPEEDILKALIHLGFKYDTTVAPGMYLDDGLTWYDFTKAPQNHASWEIRESVSAASQNTGLTEVPVFTTSMSGIAQIYYAFLKLIKGIQISPEGCIGEPASATVSSVKRSSTLKRIVKKFKRRYNMFDYCGGTTFEEMRFMMLQAYKKYRYHEGIVPIVAIGHPKNFGNADELKRFLHWASKKHFILLDDLGEKSFWQD